MEQAPLELAKSWHMSMHRKGQSRKLSVAAERMRPLGSHTQKLWYSWVPSQLQAQTFCQTHWNAYTSGLSATMVNLPRTVL